MNKKTKITVASLLITVILGVGVFFSPHLAMYSIKSAANDGDAQKLASYVDFPAVKENLKALETASFKSCCC